MSDDRPAADPPEWPGWAEIGRRWRRALCDRGRPPDDGREWRWGGEGVGWVPAREHRDKGRGRR